MAGIVVFAAMTPLGALIGLIVDNVSIDDKTKNVCVVVLLGIAVGTFLYITFFEVSRYSALIAVSLISPCCAGARPRAR